jgi:exodeoxyribonuclease VII small subunit
MAEPGAVPEVSKPHCRARVDRRDDGGRQLPLSESLAAYKRGAELLQFCQAALKDAEQQVQIFEKGVLKAFAASDGEAVRADEP